MQKTYARLFVILLFSALLASCGQNTPAAQVTPFPPSPQPSATTIPTPVPTDTFFPQSSEPVVDQMLTRLLGKLILVDGCPRVEVSDGSSILLFWPYNYLIDRTANPAEIRDDTGHVVARIGDYIWIGGGEMPGSTKEKLPNGCAGPLWIVGQGPRVLDPYFPEEAGVPVGDSSSMTGLLEGKLVLVNDCLRLQTNEDKSFLLIWPSGRYSWDKTASQVYDPYDKDIRVLIGEKIKVEGGEVPFLQSPPGDITKPMVAQPLPKECAVGPYWNVDYIRE